MPHVRLEYSSNITQDIKLNDFFSKIHSIIADIAGANLNDCKSRAYKVDNYYIGDGNAKNAFIHADIALLQGRSVDAKQQISQACFELLKESCSALSGLAIQYSVSMTDLDKDTYRK